MLQQLRSRWRASVAAFLIVTAGALGLASSVGRSSTASGNSHVSVDLHAQLSSSYPKPKDTCASHLSIASANTGNPQPVSAITERGRQLHEDNTRRTLLGRFEVDTHRRSKLEEERSRLAASPRSNKADLSSGKDGDQPLVAVHELREQLATALVRLVTLEKYEDDDNPEVIAVRKRISLLQVQIASSKKQPVPLLRRPIEPRRDDEAQLSRLNTQIALCDSKIADDLQQITQLTIRVADLSQTDKTKSVQQDLPPSLTKASANELSDGPASVPSRSSKLGESVAAPRMLQLPSRQAVAFSILLGFLFSIGVMLPFGRGDQTIANEEMLRNMLPDTVECTGSIPRMKKS